MSTDYTSARNPAAATGDTEPSTKSGRLRALLTSPKLEFLMEAHDGLSAKIVEESGFKGVWASGLSMSAAMGVRDNNEASWTQVLEVLEFMSDATSIPILVDGDTGYGNFNNMRRVVSKLCQREIAGICIEDKLFPKTNSFIGENQPLADMEEFCGKIKAGKDTQTDTDFCVVARVEALISGWGLEETLRRAHAYREAGADAVLIHSKIREADEILAFMDEWDNAGPVVIVPTTYYATPTDTFREAGVSTVIWANHNLRAAITSMREVSRQLQRDETLIEVEKSVVSVRDVFELAGNDELAEAERRYLPATQSGPRAIVLAASRGVELGALTEDRPKCMVDVRGQPLLRRLVATFNEGGIRDITVVRGYRKEMVNLPSIKTVDNDVHASTGEAATLACAIEDLKDECVVSYGDILFRHHILDQLLAAEGDIVLAADALWQERGNGDERPRDLIACSSPFRPGYHDNEPVSMVGIGPTLPPDSADGEWIGLMKLSGEGAQAVQLELDAMSKDGALGRASLTDLLDRLRLNGQTISVVYITGRWMDVDEVTDLAEAQKFL